MQVTSQNANAQMSNNENWVFVPIHKSRIIKEGEKYTLFKLDKNVSTILPKVFRRKKETDEYVFYSLPKDFNMNIRKSTYVESKKSYVDTDKLYTLDRLVGTLKLLNTPTEEEINEQVAIAEVVKDSDLPF